MKFSVKTIKILIAVHLSLLAMVFVGTKISLIKDSFWSETVINFLFESLARYISAKLFFQIASEYRKARLMRFVWQAFAICSIVFFFHALVINNIVALLTDDYYQPPLRGLLNHLFSVPANICLLFGLTGMLISYKYSGLTQQLKRQDYFIIAISVLLFGSLLLFRGNLEEGKSPWLISRILQPADLLLIACSSVISIILYRYTAIMYGGKMSKILRWLVFYGMSAGVLVLLLQILVPLIKSAFSFDVSGLNFLWALTGWFSTLAAATRAEMSSDIVIQLNELKQKGSRVSFQKQI